VDGGVEEDEGDCEGVGDVVTSGVIDVDCEGVIDDDCDDVEVGELLEDCVCEGVNVSELVPDPVKVGVTELLDVIDALAPRVTLVVGVAVLEDVIEALAEAVSLKAALILKITLVLDSTLIVVIADADDDTCTVLVTITTDGVDIADDEIITLTLEYALVVPPTVISGEADVTENADDDSITEREINVDEDIEAVFDTLTVVDIDILFDAEVVILTLEVMLTKAVGDEKNDKEAKLEALGNVVVSAVGDEKVVDDNTLDLVGEKVIDVEVETLAEQLGIAAWPAKHIAQAGHIMGTAEPMGQ
jgi:hypothetical protein